jgi:methionyl-tRNA synthetase
MTMETVQNAYESGLANGLGNLASRVLTLAEKHLEKIPTENFAAPAEYIAYIEKFDLQKAMEYIWAQIGELDKFINDEKPFSIIKTDVVKGKELIAACGSKLFVIASMLAPFLPDTSAAILSYIQENKKPGEPLFKRLEK